MVRRLKKAGLRGKIRALYRDFEQAMDSLADISEKLGSILDELNKISIRLERGEYDVKNKDLVLDIIDEIIDGVSKIKEDIDFIKYTETLYGFEQVLEHLEK